LTHLLLGRAELPLLHVPQIMIYDGDPCPICLPRSVFNVARP
jgi:hypothetical protein